jgi:hypothetical protein
MLLDLESFRRDQHGRQGALAQIDLLEQATRSALADLRALLVELREGGGAVVQVIVPVETLRGEQRS